MNIKLILYLLNIIYAIKASEHDAACDCSSDEIHLRNKLFEELRDIKSQLKFCTGKTTEKEQPNNAYSDATLSFDIRIDDTLPNIVSESGIFDIRTDTLPQKCKNFETPRSCSEATYCTERSGIYKIQIPQLSSDSFNVECDAKTNQGVYTIIQRRQDGSVDFHRDWEEYRKGFGDIQGEYFIGLDKLYALTNFMGPQELLIAMDDNKYANYNNFVIGNETEKYVLKSIGKYEGTAGDSLKYHLGSKFSTKDQDNDTHATQHCAALYTGAWWHKTCHKSNLNGKYGDETFGKGLNWFTFTGHNKSLSHVQMMIRRRRY